MKKVAFGLVIVAILTLPIFGLEYYLRWIGLGDPIVYDVDHAYGYAPRANQQKHRKRNTMVTVNESGLRSTESWTNQTKEKVLLIGDSVTWGGTRIDDRRIFAHMFCERKNKKIEEEKYLCGNAGVNGYGVLNMILRVKYDERISDAQVVIFVLYVGDFRRGWQNARIAHYFLRENDVYFRAINELISYVGFKYDVNYFFAKAPDMEPGHTTEAVDFASKLLKQLSNDLEAAGKEVYVVLSPRKGDIDFESDYGAYVVSRLRSLFPGLLLLSDPLRNEEDTFADRIHYTLSGHDAVAEYLSAEIPLGGSP